MLVDQSLPDFIRGTQGNRSRSLRFPILDNLTHSGDIRDRILKLYEIGINFGSQFLWGEGSPIFWTCVVKRTQIAMMWQSFTAIGRGSSEISWRKNKELEIWGSPAPQVRLQRQCWVVQIPLAATPPGESKRKVV